ncbi:MAG TPA: VWA domain-containing protein [Gemmataceae bacterium]|jgi:hypothetical protein
MLDFLGSFTLLNPWYLIGLGAAAIPLIIHLSRSRRTKKMRFSTTRFFTDQFLRSYRMSRLKELALLACRMALFALLAMALTQPLYMPKGTSFLGKDGSRAVVLVIDNSASMGVGDKGETMLDRARQAARTILDGLGSGDSATIVLAGRRAGGPEVLFPKPTTQLSDVRQALDRLEVAALGTNLTAALGEAEKIAQDAPAANREVYVLSDLQASGWDESGDEKPSDPSRVSFVFVRVRPEQPASNRAVTAVRYASARPMVGVPFAIRPLIAIHGDEGKEVTARLYVDGEKVGEQRIERQPNGRWAMPRFYHTFTSGGWHAGHVEVEDQAMPLDNRRYFAVQVLDTVKILAVNGAPSRVARLDELFFLRLALTASPEGQKSPIEVDTVATTGLPGADLGKYPLVVLANVEALPASTVEKLEEYVENGGSLLVFLGDKVNSRFYNEELSGPNRRHGGLLPGRLTAIEGDPAAGKDIAFIGGADYDHPALTTFQDTRFASLVGPSVTFKALWRVDAPAESLVMKASNGAPLLCEKGFGKGRVMLFTSTCDRDWTNFPIRPVFLPWTHRLVAYLAQQSLGHQAPYLTGEVVRLPSSVGDTATPLLVKKPNGAVTSARLVTDEMPSFEFDDTTQPGIYTLMRPDQTGPAGLFAVNLDGYESDLTYLDDVLDGEPTDTAGTPEARMLAGLKNRWDRPVLSYVASPGDVGDPLASARHGYKLWDYVLIVVLLIGLFEPWLANRISARLYGRPRTAPEVALPGVARAPVADQNKVEVSGR